MTVLMIIIKHGRNKSNHLAIQCISHYELWEVTTSIIKYTSILILNCLQEFISLRIILQSIKTTYAKCCVYNVKQIYEQHIFRLIFVDMPVL